MAAEEQHHILDLPTFAEPVKLLIVVAPYYRDIADDLVAGARDTIEKAGAGYDIAKVPGALEIPTAIRIADQHSNFDGFASHTRASFKNCTRKKR